MLCDIVLLSVDRPAEARLRNQVRVEWVDGRAKTRSVARGRRPPSPSANAKRRTIRSLPGASTVACRRRPTPDFTGLIWRRRWDSNSVRPFRFCKLQILQCRRCRRCCSCRSELPAIARLAEFAPVVPADISVRVAFMVRSPNRRVRASVPNLGKRCVDARSFAVRGYLPRDPTSPYLIPRARALSQVQCDDPRRGPADRLQPSTAVRSF